MTGRQNRPSQCQRAINLLILRAPGWVSVPELIDAAGAQYNARIFEARQRGYDIENKVEVLPDGRKHGKFRLRGLFPNPQITPDSPALVPRVPVPRTVLPKKQRRSRAQQTADSFESMTSTPAVIPGPLFADGKGAR